LFLNKNNFSFSNHKILLSSFTLSKQFFIMKDKILAAIKAKFPTAKLSAKRLDALAATIEAKVGTDETLIDPALDALNEIYPLTEIAKDDHIRSTLEGKLKALQNPKKKEDDVDEPVETADDILPADAPGYMKVFFAQNKKLADQISALQGEKVADTIKGKATELLKDIPPSYWVKRTLPGKIEDLDAFVEDVKNDFKEFTTEITDKNLKVVSGPPKGGAGNGAAGDGKDKASKEEVEAVIENIM